MQIFSNSNYLCVEEICRLKDVYKVLHLFEKEFAEKNGITINEGMILCCLKDGSSKAANELCDFVGLSNSRVSRIIHSAEKKELIQRRMGIADKRQMIFTLTETGKLKVQEMLAKEMDLSSLVRQITGIFE